MRNNVTKPAVALATAMGWLAFNALPALAQSHQVNLTGYQPGMGRFLDPKLNGWGMVARADGSFCVANASTGVATFYQQSGKPLPLVVTVPPAPSQPFGPVGSPAGIVYNPTS